MSSKKIRMLFWGTIILGMVLPIVVMAIVELIFSRKSLLSAFISAVSFFSNDLWGFLSWLLHNIPFIFLAFLIKSQLQGKTESPKQSVLRLSETLGAGIMMISFSLFLNLSIWIWNTSTAVLAYFTFPFYGIISILIGCGGGWTVGKIIVWVQSLKEKRLRPGSGLQT